MIADKQPQQRMQLEQGLVHISQLPPASVLWSYMGEVAAALHLGLPLSTHSPVSWNSRVVDWHPSHAKPVPQHSSCYLVPPQP